LPGNIDSFAAQPGTPGNITVAQVFSQQQIPIFTDAWLRPDRKSGDTVCLQWNLINEWPKDTVVYIAPGDNDWVEITARCLADSCAGFSITTGGKFIGRNKTDYLYYEALPLPLARNSRYAVTLRLVPVLAQPDTAIHLLTHERFLANTHAVKKHRSVNHSINFVFMGTLLFSFLFFLAFFLINSNRIFGWYVCFLCCQLLYGYLHMDLHTWVGGFLPQRYYWEQWLSEAIIFTGQAIYIQFVARWLHMKATSRRTARWFNGASILYVLYVIVFVTLYFTSRPNPWLLTLLYGIRVVSAVVLLVLFYVIIFHIKANGRFFVLTGSLCVMLLGVVMVSISESGGFNNTVLADVRSGSWYMLGIMCESFCFSMGLGFYYYLLQKENLALQLERMKTEEQKLKDRLAMSQDLHDQAGATLSSISIYSEAAKTMNRTGRKAELEDVIDKISTASARLTAEMSDIIWAINPKNDSLQKVLERMEAYARPLMLAKDIRFSFAYDKGIAALLLNAEYRKNIYLVFKEAINNALKYAGCAEITVNIRLQNQELLMRIKDDGVGFSSNDDSQTLSGNGLKNMRARAAAMNGHLQIGSQPGAGTTLLLRLTLPT
jgi:signal transduction histidine kinase